MPLSRGEAPSVPFFVPTVNLGGLGGRFPFHLGVSRVHTETPLCPEMAQFRFVGGLQTTPDRGRLWLFLAQLHELLESTSYYILRSQFATARGSNLTHVPILKHGIRPAAACLKIVTLDTERTSARSSAVKARPVFSI